MKISLNGHFQDFKATLRDYQTQLRRRSSTILEERSVKSLLEVGNQYQLSTTLSLNPISSSPPQTNKLHNAMEIGKSFTPKVATKSLIQYQWPSPKIFEEFLLQHYQTQYCCCNKHQHTFPALNKIEFI